MCTQARALLHDWADCRARVCLHLPVFTGAFSSWTREGGRFLERVHVCMPGCVSARARGVCVAAVESLPLSLSLSLIFLPAASPPLQFQYRPPSRSISALHPPSPSSSSPSSSSSALAPLPLQVDGGWEPRRQKPWPGCAAGRARWC